MEITGKIISLLPLQKGQGKNGEWKKQDVVVETSSNYPKKVCISIWGDKIDQFNIAEGESVTFSVEVESREYNGRWYTDVKAWKVNKGTESPSSTHETPDVSSFSSDEPEDLPF